MILGWICLLLLIALDIYYYIYGFDSNILDFLRNKFNSLSLRSWSYIAATISLLIVFTVFINIPKATVPNSSSYFIGKTLDEVKEEFEKEGFYNIVSVPVRDLQSGKDKDKTVRGVEIAGDISFKKGEKYWQSTEIKIKHHDFPEDYAKLSIDTNKNLEEIAENLRSNGFTRVSIETVPLKLKNNGEEVSFQEMRVSGKVYKGVQLEKIKSAYFPKSSDLVLIKYESSIPLIPLPSFYNGLTDVEKVKKALESLDFSNIKETPIPTEDDVLHNKMYSIDVEDENFQEINGNIEASSDAQIVLHFYHSKKAAQKIEEEKRREEEKIQKKAEEKQKEEQERKDEEEKALDYLEKMEIAANFVNATSGTDIVSKVTLSTSKQAGALIINLNPNILYAGALEIKAAIQSLNESLVISSTQYGYEKPILHYYLNGNEVAVNRYILNPPEVKFRGILK
ncbi:hypothetical protein [Streptococcus himalayensis]|uniref:Uncharacterized protein n=2 Tax=Streptococcus himalayensis TaxID=1888195 RepID=A0A917A3R3_9STRE|nr:hypothetical protein [Streptococcus himalayensis]GGE25355.1 hypothetical protein GCM10011510_03060 [Streptococcus himalayensis]